MIANTRGANQRNSCEREPWELEAARNLDFTAIADCTGNVALFDDYDAALLTTFLWPSGGSRDERSGSGFVALL
jgi:hypothetical protein